MTLAPRSWPSSPTFATKTLIGLIGYECFILFVKRNKGKILSRLLKNNSAFPVHGKRHKKGGSLVFYRFKPDLPVAGFHDVLYHCQPQSHARRFSSKIGDKYPVYDFIADPAAIIFYADEHLLI